MATATVKAPNRPIGFHLASVIREMRERGSPVIRVHNRRDGGPLLALEGSHRLAAAVELGLPVTLLHLKSNDLMVHDFENLKPNPCPVAKIVEYLEEDLTRPVYTVNLLTRKRHRS